MVSAIITRPWLRAVVDSRSSASDTTATALSKPKVRSVQGRSLSIVLGTPTTGRPNSWKRLAMPIVPSPPITTRPSSPSVRA